MHLYQFSSFKIVSESDKSLNVFLVKMYLLLQADLLFPEKDEMPKLFLSIGISHINPYTYLNLNIGIGIGFKLCVSVHH